MHVALESWGVHAQLSLPVNTASFRGWSGSLFNNSSLGDDAPQTAPSSVQPFLCGSRLWRSTSTSVLGHFGPFFEDRTDRGPEWLKTDLVESLRSLGPNCTSEGPICTSWYYTQNVSKSMTVEEEDTHRNILREGVDFMIESLCLLIELLINFVIWGDIEPSFGMSNMENTRIDAAVN